jgi:hypothetical protein
VALRVAFVCPQLGLLNPHPTKEASKEKMIQSSEGMIRQEIVYVDSINFSKTGLCGLYGLFRWKAFN